MKKVIILVSIAAIGFAMFANKKPEANGVPQNEPLQEAGQDFFKQYNNMIVIDKKGYWTVVIDGKLRPAATEDLSRQTVTLDQDIWEHYTTNFPKLIIT